MLFIYTTIIGNRTTFKMTKKQRTVHFADLVELILEDEENHIDRSFISTNQPSNNYEDSADSTSSTNRSAWTPSEISFFSDHHIDFQKLDVTPRKPKRSLDSILDDAINTCEALIAMSPSEREREEKIMIPPKHFRLDRSLFSIRSSTHETRLPPPPPLSHSCIVSHALNEIMR